MARPLPHSFARLAYALALVCLAAFATGCPGKPTMKLNHAQISGVSISFPPSLGVLMVVYIDVYNPNSYDVAIRAVRGQVVLADRYTLPVDFRANGDGVWLASRATTPFAVPVSVPVDLAVTLLRDSMMTPSIAYRFSGRADVTATRTFQLEKDDYSVDERGFMSRQEIQAAIGRSF